MLRNPEPSGTPTIFTGPDHEEGDDKDYIPQLTKKGEMPVSVSTTASHGFFQSSVYL